MLCIHFTINNIKVYRICGEVVFYVHPPTINKALNNSIRKLIFIFFAIYKYNIHVDGIMITSTQLGDVVM